MAYYCLQCNARCEYEMCVKCDDNPDMLYVEHPGFTSDAEIQQEIDEENFWYEYDQR